MHDYALCMTNGAKNGSKRKSVLLALAWYHPKIHAGVAAFAKKSHWHLNTDLARLSGAIPHGWHGDGVIRQSHFANKGQKAFFESRNVPCVIFGNDPNYPSVSDDHVGVVECAAAHFLERNFHNFAGYCPVKRGFRIRMDGFKEVIERAGYACPLLVPKRGLSWSEKQAWLAQALASLPKPVGVWAENDESAAELIEACMDHGISIPDEVAVLGVRNDELICGALNVSLSSVDNNLFGMGYEAANLLHRVFEGEDLRGVHVTMPPKGVVVRASSDMIAVDVKIPGLKRALQIMADRFDEPDLTCDDVAHEAGVSRRSLFAAFKRGVGRTPHAEILRLRMNEAKRLLVERPNMKLETVASRCGYPIMRSFFAAFKRYFDKTPTEIR